METLGDGEFKATLNSGQHYGNFFMKVVLSQPEFADAEFIVVMTANFTLVACTAFTEYIPRIKRVIDMIDEELPARSGIDIIWATPCSDLTTEEVSLSHTQDDYSIYMRGENVVQQYKDSLCAEVPNSHIVPHCEVTSYLPGVACIIFASTHKIITIWESRGIAWPYGAEDRPYSILVCTDQASQTRFM